MIEGTNIRHIAFIMDGNGRWASARKMTREQGHSQGAKAFRRIVEYCGEIGSEYITVYAFSTENWQRPLYEIASIMQLLSEYIDEASAIAESRDLSVRFLGLPKGIAGALLTRMKALEKQTSGYGKHLNIAFNYGGRAEIVDAVNRLIADGKKVISESDITEKIWSGGECPPPDLIIRTAGEKRLSNFLLWQSAYSELYFTEKLWPDMEEADVDSAVADYKSRTRRYGAVV